MGYTARLYLKKGRKKEGREGERGTRLGPISSSAADCVTLGKLLNFSEVFRGVKKKEEEDDDESS